MKRVKFAALFLFLFAFVSGLWAQGPAANQKKVWTLQECVNYALENNLQVKRSELNLKSSEVDLTQSRMNLLPNANANGSYGYNWGRGLDPVTNEFTNSLRNNVSSLGASSSVTVFNSLRTQNLIRQNSSALAASEQNLEKSKNDVTLNVVSFFVNVIFNKELLENSRVQLTTSQQQLERTKKLVIAGSAPKVDELNLEAEVASNELTVINQENSLNQSILQLKQAMQIPASEDFDVAIPEIAAEDLVLSQSRDEIFDIAKAVMPEIRSSIFSRESSRYGVKAAKANFFPRITLNGSLNTNYSKSSEAVFVPNDDIITYEIGTDINGSPVYATRSDGTTMNLYKADEQFKDNLYKSLSLSLIIPIFNNYTTRAGVRRSEIANVQAEINILEAENTLRQTIETAYNDAVASSKTYASSQKQIQAREEAFRITKQRYDVGASNYVDWLVSQNNLFQAKTDLSRAKYNFIFKKKVLDFYQGKPIGL